MMKMLCDRVSGRCWAVFTVAFVLVGGVVPSAWAHPHVWIDLTTRILQAEGQKVARIRQVWSFDEFYSSYSKADIDVDKNGTLDAEEKQIYANNTLNNLQEWTYFTYPETAQGAAVPFSASDPVVDFVDGHFIFAFTLAFDTPIALPELVFSSFDPSNYIAIAWPDANGADIQNLPKGCRVRIIQPNIEAYEERLLSEDAFEKTPEELGLNDSFGKLMAQQARFSCLDKS
jgi:ABC-type uncharacterized transport system substrate-binding protein